MSDYIILNGELYHYGIKGMKWGVRRYQNADGKKRQDRIDRAKDDAANARKIAKSYTDSVNKAGQARIDRAKNDAATARKLGMKNVDKFDRKVESRKAIAEKNSNKASKRAERYVNAFDKKVASREKAAKVTQKGVEKTAKILNKIGMAYLTDQIFYGGRGTKLAKAAVKTTGRAAVTAFVMARGGYDIRWYDK